MRAVIQRVSKASVKVNDKVVGEIGKGLLVLIGVGKDDNEKDISYMAEKIVNLRIFEDENGKMNKSLLDIKGEILIISQFTLYGDCRRGRRPSFTDAASPDKGKEYYEKFVKEVKKYGVNVQTGIFQAMMEVELINQGPVTILLDSKKIF